MATGRRLPWVLMLCGAAAACSLTVGQADLGSVECSEENAIGTPVCADGQICLGGKCQRCATVDLCGDGIDNDCMNGADDGCAGSGGQGGNPEQGGSAGEGGQGGQGGKDASPDQSAGGGSGEGGAGGGAAGQGGAQAGGSAGTGEGGASAGGTAGSSGGGTGGTVQQADIGGDCGDDSGCKPGLFCFDGDGPAPNTCTKACCTSSACGTDFVCVAGYSGGVCVHKSAVGGETGPALPGASCNKANDCRSGRCVNQKCLDLCCAAGNCTSGSGTVCMLLSGTGSYACQVDDGKSALAECCKSDDCLMGIGCTYSYLNDRRGCFGDIGYGSGCCTSADCGGGRCRPVDESGDKVLQCQ